MSAAPARALDLIVGARLLLEEPLEWLGVDVRTGSIELRTERHVVLAAQVCAANLLGPWDGATGVVEWLEVVAIEGGAICVELRVRFATVPRHYRLVARSLQITPRG